MPLSDDDRQFLFDLLRTPSPTGFEAPGQRLWAARAGARADRVESDAYGSAWATRDGADGAPTVLLEAHADEIGFAVKYVTDEGFLRVDRIGGSDQAIARGRRIMLLGSKGPVPGVLGNTAIHLRDRKDDEKAPKIEDLFVDVGASSPDEVAALGLRVGHPAVYADAAEMLTEGRVTGRALDNRLGGFVLTQVLAELAGGEHAATVTALNAVQEEIGGNGAKMAAYAIRPDVAVVLDVTHATDSPGIEKAKHGDVRLGAGPSVTHGTVNHPAVVERLMDGGRGRERHPAPARVVEPLLRDGHGRHLHHPARRPVGARLDPDALHALDRRDRRLGRRRAHGRAAGRVRALGPGRRRVPDRDPVAPADALR